MSQHPYADLDYERERERRAVLPVERHTCTYDGKGSVTWADDGSTQFIGVGARAFAKFCYWAALNNVEIKHG